MTNQDQDKDLEEVLTLFKVEIEGDFEEWFAHAEDAGDVQVKLDVIKKNLNDDSKTTQKSFSVMLSTLDLPEESFTEAEHYTDHFVVYAAVELGCSCSNPEVREYLGF